MACMCKGSMNQGGHNVRKVIVGLIGTMLLVGLVLAGCGGTSPEPPATGSASGSGSAGSGTLHFRANGEDFIRQGFVSKDGWMLNFDHVYVTLADITAYQSDPPFDATAGGTPQAVVTATLEQPVYTVDLAEGDAQAEPILIDMLEAPAGRYNALSWNMVKATEGPASGAVIVLQGTATQDNQTMPFTIRLDQQSSQFCGDYVGDTRKGILEADGIADLEATFHFDHLFGDGEAAPDDAINTDSLGFAPFAALAKDGTVDVAMSDIEAGFSAEDLDHLGTIHMTHVGEGHCEVVAYE